MVMGDFLVLAFGFSVIIAIGMNFSRREPGEGYGKWDLIVWIPPVLIVMLYNYLNSTQYFEF
jgi:hypothetical protein